MFLTRTRRRTPAPSNDAVWFERPLDRIFDDAFASWPFGRLGEVSVTSSPTPAVDVSEDDTQVKLIAELPGVKPEDVKISVEDYVLTIRGEKKHEAGEKSERLHRYERAYGAFERTFSLPNTVNTDEIEASYENGVLSVVLPKAERARPREIPVKTS